MLSNKLAFAALAVACIAAAAGGGYLASRQNTVPTPASAQAPPVAATAPGASAPSPAASTDRPVTETEAIVGEKPTPTTTASTTARRADKPRETTMTARATPPPARSQIATPAAQAPAQPPVSTPPPAVEPPAPKPEERAATPPSPPEPARPQYEEVVVSRDSVIGLQTEGPRISSETAKVEDRVEARVTRDVRVADRIAIPAGSRAIGAVTLVEKGGKFKERARLGIRFHTLVFADGTRVPINTETIFREGEAQGADTAKKIGGGAVVGTILGGILGGAKGAAIGATAGAGAGTAAAAAGGPSEAVLLPGTPLTVRLNQPVTVTQER